MRKLLSVMLLVAAFGLFLCAPMAYGLAAFPPNHKELPDESVINHAAGILNGSLFLVCASVALLASYLLYRKGRSEEESDWLRKRAQPKWFRRPSV